MTLRETEAEVAEVKSRLEKHEAICEHRYKQLEHHLRTVGENIDEVRGHMAAAAKAGWAVAAGVVIFAVQQGFRAIGG